MRFACQAALCRATMRMRSPCGAFMSARCMPQPSNVQRQQKEWFGGRLIASDLRNPDFCKFAESFGIRAERVTSPEALRAALVAALDRNAPALIEVPCGDMASPWPFIIRPPVFETA